MIHPGATLTPHFRDFLPSWLGRQPWYAGHGLPAISAVGFFRMEDPAGEVGIETHLVSDGSCVYQIPMTYRGAPLRLLADGSPAGGSTALITTAEHSVLGTRWIYDAVADPVWAAETRRLVASETAADTNSKRGAGAADARGVRSASWPDGIEPVVDLNRVLVSGPPAEGPDVLGTLMGSWHANGAGTPPVRGCLAVLRHPNARPQTGL